MGEGYDANQMHENITVQRSRLGWNGKGKPCSSKTTYIVAVNFEILPEKFASFVPQFKPLQLPGTIVDGVVLFRQSTALLRLTQPTLADMQHEREHAL